MSKHTPGPWAIERNARGTIIESIGPCVPGEYAGSAWLELSEEDALLIASAPDLLQAAKLVLAWYEAENDHSKVPDFYERMAMCRASEDAIRAAIAKAEGGAV